MRRLIIFGLMVVSAMAMFLGLTCQVEAKDIIIKIYQDKQKITFPVVNGRVTGIIMKPGEAFPRLGQVIEVGEQSDRAGYIDTVARGKFNSQLKGGTIHNTCNSDKALWFVTLKNGSLHYLNREKIKIVYDKSLGNKIPPPKKLENGYIQYGSYNPESIAFISATRSMEINFHNNRFTNLVVDGKIPYDLELSAISSACWFSEVVGWFNDSHWCTSVTKNGDGNFVAVIPNMPEGDWGYVAFEIAGGKYADKKWAWIWADKWSISGAGATINKSSGEIMYDFSPSDSGN